MQRRLSAVSMVAGCAAVLAIAPPPAAADPTVLLAVAAPAHTDDPVLLARQWPGVPEGHGLSLEAQITDRINDLGNSLGQQLDLLSHDLFQLHVDARNHRAHLRLGGGSDELLAVRIDSDIQFDDDANAYVHARIDLGFHGHSVALQLPAFEMCPTSYRGGYGVELKLPLFVRQF